MGKKFEKGFLENNKYFRDIEKAEENAEMVSEVMAESMAKMNPVFKTKDWSDTHPLSTVCGSDKFYAELASRLFCRFSLLRMQKGMPDGTLYIAAQSIAAYLEDMVSETGVWQAVRNIYREIYGKRLPFYDVDPEDYFENDINVEDLRLLVWIAFSRCGDSDEMVFSPVSEAVFRMADIAFDMLVDCFDKAPKATRVRDNLRRAFSSDDYFIIRELGYWLNVQNPLTATPFIEEYIKDGVDKAMKSFRNHFKESQFGLKEALYFEKVAKSWLSHVSVLGCHTSVLLSELASIHKFPVTAKNLKKVKVLKSSVYIIGDTKGKYATLIDEVGRETKALKSSFGKNMDWDSYKSGILSLVRYGDDYYQNGVASFTPELPKKPDKVILNELTDEMKAKVRSIIDENEGRRIYYCKTPKDVSKLLNTPPISKEDLKNIGKHYNYLVILSDTEGIIVQPDWCGVFEDPENPFRKSIQENKLGNKQFGFICSVVLPDDSIEYIVDGKYLTKAYIHASQGKEVGLKIVQENMAFFFRFYRVETYPAPEYLTTSADDDYE